MDVIIEIDPASPEQVSELSDLLSDIGLPVVLDYDRSGLPSEVLIDGRGLTFAVKESTLREWQNEEEE